MGKQPSVPNPLKIATAILSFDNFTKDIQLDWVAEGMHSTLIRDMGKVSGLRVLGKTTSKALIREQI